MKTRLVAGFALAGAAILVSCTQDQPGSRLLPTQASFSVAPAACSFTAIHGARIAYLGSGGPALALITLMEQAYNGAGGGAAGAAAATSRGFDVLAQLGTVTDQGSPPVIGTPAQGSAYANAVLSCMSVAGYDAVIDFAPALGPNGLFAVRDNSTNTPVVSRLVVAGAPAFGAEPSTGNWPLASKTLFYGVKLTVPNLANETPAGDVFELTTLPSGLTFTPQIKTGVCDVSDPSAQILHQHANDPAVILPPAGLPSFCPAPTSARQSTSSFALAAGQVAEWLAPRPAFAARTRAFAFGGGGAGLVSGLSHIGPVSFTSTVAYVQPPRNTRRSANPQFVPTVVVRNVSAQGNPIQGSLITITVTVNNGSFNISGNTATTNSAGIATFPNLKIDKPGGYTATATSSTGGSAVVTFQINGQ
jgi:hypothetical protein